MTTGDLAIETVGLTKRFGKQTAVNSVDLSVPTGSVFGFLGPNGSGKTTTIRMLLGLVGATSGQATVLGHSMPEKSLTVLPEVGALVEGPGFYPFLSGAANLHRLDGADRHTSSSTRSQRVETALERVGLGEVGSKKVKAYSLGMKQRLGLAGALLSPRRLIVLDEPTNGLDPQGTREVRSLVRSLTEEGTTVFVSSHLLAEIEQICTHAAIMSVGNLVAQGTIEQLRSQGAPTVTVSTPDAADAIAALAALGLAAELLTPGSTHTDDSALVTAALGLLDPDSIMPSLVSAGVRVRGFTVLRPSLEDLFVELTGEGFDVAG